MKLLKILFYFLLPLQIFAQSAIKGTISDSSTHESLIGALVVIKGQNKGAVTDPYGNFEIQNLNAGLYKIEIRYATYKNIILDVILGDNETKSLDVKLQPQVTEIKTITLVHKSDKSSTTDFIRLQRNSAVVMDGINSETFKRTPDSKVSDVLKRISGVSVIDNKFIVVRGLSNRYNFALINGIPLPSSETDYKAFSFDIFPSNMIDNVIIYKSATPDLPGEFAGGVIDINSAETNYKNFQNLQISTSYNTLSTFKDFRTYKGNGYDLLGVGKYTRELPSNIPNTTDFTFTNKIERADYAKSMDFTWNTTNRLNLPGLNLQYSLGRELELKNERKFGYVIGYGYQNVSSQTKIVRREFEEQSTGVITKMVLNDSVYTESVLNSGMINLFFDINTKNSIKFKNIYTINSEDKVNYRKGGRELDIDHQWEKSINFWYTQNNLYTGQLLGNHEVKKVKLNWNLGYSNINKTIPNLRRVVYRKNSFLEDDTTQQYFAVIQTNGTIPTAAGNMFWSETNEKIYSGRIDATIPIYKKNILKFGAFSQYRNRFFNSRNLGFSQYKPQGSSFDNSLLSLSESKLFSVENMGLLDSGKGGFKLEEATSVDDSYDANSLLNASYIMGDVDLLTKIKLIGGVRFESYNQKFNYVEFGSFKQKHIDTTLNDFLPSLNLIYSLNKKIKIRTSYYKTLSRPEFRELAPFNFYNFIQDNITSGNINLKRAVIHNFDFRFEYYPSEGQNISVSGFYKKFTNPIEVINRTGTSGAPELYYSNAEGAINYGCELEYKIKLSLLSKDNKFLNNLSWYSNLSLINSIVDLNKFIGSGNERPLQGQSPYLINTGLFYRNESNFSVSLSYNLIGDRIYIVGNIQEPSVWEKGRNVLDFQISKTFKNLEFKLNVKDILAQDLLYYQDLNGNKKYDSGVDNRWQEVKFGQTISISAKYNFH